MTTTDIVLLPSTISPLFSPEGLSDEEFFDFQAQSSEYTAGEIVDVRKLLSRRASSDEEKKDKIVWLWGFYCFPKTHIDESSGLRNDYIAVIFRLGTEHEPLDQYVSFGAKSAVWFVERTLMPFIARGKIGPFDWQVGLPVQIWAHPLTQGQSYDFKLVKRS